MKLKIIFGIVFFSVYGQLAHSQDLNYEEWYLRTTDSLSLYVKEIKGGSKDTIIVVHGGFGANHDYMHDAIKGLEQDFHFVLYDQRGSLMSPAPKEKLTFGNNVEDIIKLINELKLNKATLLCHSMGTLVGMEFSKRYPEKVKKLILTAPLSPVNEGDFWTERMGNQVKYLTERKEVESVLEIYREKDRNGDLTDKDRTKWWRAEFASANIYKIENRHLLKGGKIFYKQEAAVMAESVNWDYDYRKVLNDIGNVYVITGAYDFIDFNGETYKNAIKEYPNIQLEVIKNAGHNIWIDEPKLFYESLKQVLFK